MTPYQTGAVSLSAGMIGAVIVWILGLFHVPQPPDAVVAALGAIVLTLAHVAQTITLPRRSASAQPAPIAPATKES